MILEAAAPEIEEQFKSEGPSAVKKILSIVEKVGAKDFRGEHLKHYFAPKPVAVRRDRNNAIRAEYNGRNVRALAKKFGVSPRTVFRIISGRK